MTLVVNLVRAAPSANFIRCCRRNLGVIGVIVTSHTYTEM